ncbi:hypothetical protein DFP72DRAFT_473791 [Ephemerocybe angulata]|uniref:Uncharacterized protein n=1 Tax=Ephemerocybe angulata TaxID=980116 RepID=A0A8H6HSV7_9AGAR|nr:hypothetical protein DFP72DRAFT_473791 [Tulosesus angulatus]
MTAHATTTALSASIGSSAFMFTFTYPVPTVVSSSSAPFTTPTDDPSLSFSHLPPSLPAPLVPAASPSNVNSNGVESSSMGRANSSGAASFDTTVSLDDNNVASTTTSEHLRFRQSEPVAQTFQGGEDLDDAVSLGDGGDEDVPQNNGEEDLFDTENDGDESQPPLPDILDLSTSEGMNQALEDELDSIPGKFFRRLHQEARRAYGARNAAGPSSSGTSSKRAPRGLGRSWCTSCKELGGETCQYCRVKIDQGPSITRTYDESRYISAHLCPDTIVNKLLRPTAYLVQPNRLNLRRGTFEPNPSELIQGQPSQASLPQDSGSSNRISYPATGHCLGRSVGCLFGEGECTSMLLVFCAKGHTSVIFVATPPNAGSLYVSCADVHRAVRDAIARFDTKPWVYRENGVPVSSVVPPSELNWGSWYFGGIEQVVKGKNLWRVVLRDQEGNVVE